MQLVVVMRVENTRTELMTCYSKRASDFVLRRKNSNGQTVLFAWRLIVDGSLLRVLPWGLL